MTNSELKAALDRTNDRMRQILMLLADAPKEWTSIPDAQGAFQGYDQFVGVALIDEAGNLLARWDEEDAALADSSPPSRSVAEERG